MTRALEQVCRQGPRSSTINDQFLGGCVSLSFCGVLLRPIRLQPLLRQSAIFKISTSPSAVPGLYCRFGLLLRLLCSQGSLQNLPTQRAASILLCSVNMSAEQCTLQCCRFLSPKIFTVPPSILRFKNRESSPPSLSGFCVLGDLST